MKEFFTNIENNPRRSDLLNKITTDITIRPKLETAIKDIKD